ncbi:MAG: hypothetical protein R3C26_07615 [Calditrichia bacterium]
MVRGSIDIHSGNICRGSRRTAEELDRSPAAGKMTVVENILLLAVIG